MKKVNLGLLTYLPAEIRNACRERSMAVQRSGCYLGAGKWLSGRVFSVSRTNVSGGQGVSTSESCAAHADSW